jgi:hypothetical protein
MHLRTKHPDGREHIYPVTLTIEGRMRGPVDPGFVEAVLVDDDGAMMAVDHRVIRAGGVVVQITPYPALTISLSNATRRASHRMPR